jgi:hypothetical protein
MIRPEYYRNGGDIDVIEFARIVIGEDAAKHFCQVNIIKYAVRYAKKNGIEDLEKARTYIARLKELEGAIDGAKNQNGAV